ncbi:unnamed protein product [Mytilus edulis]|uniref:Uncharacterized protein n=1 Tax=Mytilus edulis TaxID=6550 RepID=A0A8S3SKW0_MYTED|nr:unnamed protein product [Mytilus edulis]
MEVPMPIDFPMPGAFSSEQPCNQEVRDLVAQTAEQLTAALNGRNPGEITAVSFRMQIVAGEMYIVKEEFTKMVSGEGKITIIPKASKKPEKVPKLKKVYISGRWIGHYNDDKDNNFCLYLDQDEMVSELEGSDVNGHTVYTRINDSRQWTGCYDDDDKKQLTLNFEEADESQQSNGVIGTGKLFGSRIWIILRLIDFFKHRIHVCGVTKSWSKQVRGQLYRFPNDNGVR